MKENRNLIILIITIAMAGICYLLYILFFSPMLLKVNEASLALAQQEQKLLAYQTQNAGLDDLKEMLLDRAHEVDSDNKGFLPDLDTDKITYLINTISTAQKMTPSGVYFGEKQKLLVLSEVLAEEGVSVSANTTPAVEGEVTEPERPEKVDILQKVDYDLEVNSMSVEVRFLNVNYAQILAFMKAVEAEERTIYFVDFSADHSTTNTLNVSLRYNFYSADKVTEDDTGLKTVPEATTGKADPFR